MNRGWGHAEMSGNGVKAAGRQSATNPAKAGAAGGKAPSEPSVAIEAMRMLGKWTLLSQRHVSADMGCSCCSGFGNVQVQDFEQQILDYLHDKYSAAGNARVVALLGEHAAFRHREAGSIADMLRSLATKGVDATHGGDALAMLADLANSIDSFDKMGY